MKIYSLSKVLIIPLLAMLVLIYFITEQWGRDYSVLVFIPVTLGVILYIFHGDIDYWYLKKNPFGLDRPLIEWITKYFVPYREMEGELKKKFENRLELYLYGRLFQAVGKEMKNVPEDIKCMVASYAVWMTLYLDDYLIGDFDRIFLYKHHFPTPQNNVLHAVETNNEDGVIILNTNLCTQAVLNPADYYNIIVHAFAECILSLKADIPLLTEENLPEIISGWKKEDILTQTGLKEIDERILHIHHFFIFRELYTELLPENTKKLKAYFNIP
jgi:hypothetical protein